MQILAKEKPLSNYTLMLMLARSLIANAQDLKETWLKPALDSVLKGYSCIRKDRSRGSGGRCAVFIRRGVKHRQLMMAQKFEVIVVEVWTKEGSL